MIYTPYKDPKKAFLIISTIILVGVVGGFFNKWFIVGALFFWMQYTVVLSYLQFKRGSEHSYNSFTEIMLHPQVRFFLFEFLATIGILALFLENWVTAGIIILIVWWLFALNFYRYYTK